MRQHLQHRERMMAQPGYATRIKIEKPKRKTPLVNRPLNTSPSR
jgi:hypothetical protein